MSRRKDNPTDWTVADIECKWNSVMVGDVTPADWNGWIGPSVLLLKDTRKGLFTNRLDDGRTFLYQLPAPKSKAQDAVSKRFYDEANAAQKSIEVRLFSVECARNFYLGEWVISRIEQNADGRIYARLLRLAKQDTNVQTAYKIDARPKRSRSEGRHEDVIRSLLPGWRVDHEPECVAFYDSELVVDGKMREWGGDQYTSDYVAACGSRRVCFESKASEAGLDEAAKLKCRSLRDHSMTRVVALVGHGDRMTWYDFGCPAMERSESRETMGRSVTVLQELLQ